MRVPIYVVDGVKVEVERTFKNEGDSVCERIVNFIYEKFLESRQEQIPKKGE